MKPFKADLVGDEWSMRKRYRNRTGIGIIAFAVMILFGIVAFARIGLEEREAKAELKIKRLEAQIQVQKERATEIDNFKAYVQTKRYIEDMAREKLGLVYQDEIIFQKEDDETDSD